MIPNSVMSGIVFQMAIALLLPIILIIVFKKKKMLSWKSFGVGVLVFILFSQILEKILHYIVLAPSGTELKWTANPYCFALYGGLAAGVFEEMGRFLAFKWLLKKNREYKDGLSLGLGHGGIEAILIGVLGGVNSLIMASLINSGKLDKLLGGGYSQEHINLIKDQFIHQGFSMFAAGGIERMFAIALQLAFSLLVLYGIRKSQFKFVIYAILVHAGIDFLAAFYQAGLIKSIWPIEGFLAVIAVFAILFIVKMKPEFEKIK
ncbi:YhfC family intramembrane metalloprotease [Fictibacillus gelatini]|uniref:YhfC family intramembrane metalloprotease n=1 Tax=Fictibacillus gelatini TaxID=225985 RepID=UPI000415095B|nr:YhfC family intramembrane metalloprotease [Fictibacillus gelatini]